MNRKLLLVIPTFIGFRVFLWELAEELDRRGWSVHLACSTTNYPAQVHDLHAAVLHEVDFARGSSPLGHLRASAQIRSLVNQIDPDLIHAHFSAGIISTALARRKTWPCTIGTFQGLIHPLEEGWRRIFYRAVERWATRRLDGAWVLTPDDVAALKGMRRVHRQQTPGFGVDQRRFDPARFSPADRDRIRSRWGANKDDRIFIYVGRLTTFKGFPATAQAALQVVQSHAKVHFVFVGTEDPLHSSGLDDGQWSQVRHHPRIHFVGWSDEVPLLLFASDCFVFPSSREGMAVSIMEALSMGLPVITTSARGCGDLIEHGRQGFIVAKNAEAVTATLRQILDDPGQLEPLKRAALAQRDRLARKRYIEEQITVYEALLYPRSNRPHAER